MRGRLVVAKSTGWESQSPLSTTILPPMIWGRVLVAAGLVSVLGACWNAETRRCHAEMTAAQEIVARTEDDSLESVGESISAVQRALAACIKADRDHEIEELTKAKEQLELHRGRLAERGARRSRKEVSAEELKRLLAEGDPSCPRGQAYVERGSGKQVRCSGRLVIEMTRAELAAYYERRGFKVTVGDVTHQLRAEYGAQLEVFSFSGANADARVKCVELYPAPGVSWQEAVARATGVQPARLEPGKDVRTTRGALRLEVEESSKKVVARIGACSG